MEKYSARAIDELGRFVLHSEIRKALDWNTGDKVAVYVVDENTVILQKAEKKLKEQQAITFTSSD